ncbi:hypothetical protein P8452_66155 [Trifolium repens]|nr:hypothetical protein QL285_088062 [Trifolium repens]KAK2429514.1 hypothetical protein QL285_027946 [Trifolium repens]WJX83495.1 hypothetical protein P8452_66155 [Trifolium repens]
MTLTVSISRNSLCLTPLSISLLKTVLVSYSPGRGRCSSCTEDSCIKGSNCTYRSNVAEDDAAQVAWEENHRANQHAKYLERQLKKLA